MIVGSLRVSLYADGSRSLKDKRQVLRKIKDTLRHRFNISIAETAHQDDLKRIHLGIATAASSQEQARLVLDEVLRTIESSYAAQLLGSERDFVRYDEAAFIGLEEKI